MNIKGQNSGFVAQNYNPILEYWLNIQILEYTAKIGSIILAGAW